MSPANQPPSRKLVYMLLIVLAAGSAAGRICATSRVFEPELARDETNPADRRGKWPSKRPEPMPTFSSNDRSRWATVEALVDEGTYVIGKRDRSRIVASAVSPLAAADPLQEAALAVAGYQTRITADSGIIFQDGWQSVDKVLNPQTLEFYSTKPPLLATLIAGIYWLLQQLFGWTLAHEPFAVVRTTLLLVNLAPFVVYLRLLVRLLERYAVSEWTRYVVLASACFATLVTPFLITLNNHTAATFCVVFALYPVMPLLEWPWGGGSAKPPWAFALSGFFAGFVVCNELPALAFTAGLGSILLMRCPKQTLLFFVPAAAIPLAALMLTNFAAMGEWVPAYSKFGGPWYEYEGSHWRKPPEGQVKYGIDWARYHETRIEYAVHVLVGHHGVFSLTPIWLFAAGGMVWGAARLRQKAPSAGPDKQGNLNLLAVLTLLVTLVVLAFYLMVDSANYGGWTAGLRWLMWLTPLWVLAMIPVVEVMGRQRWSRGVVYLLLAWSVFSMSYPAWNPWRHPWLYNLLESGGYIPY